MAGAGYKLFNTGDVLTAAQVNTYLQEQAVMRFATVAARTSALSGVLAEGMVSYIDATDTLEFYNGSAWVAVNTTAGDITGVTAGTGISGGGTSGDVTITNSMATTIDAKGDLIAGTADNTFSRLAVGANNTILTADSTQSTGLAWTGGWISYTPVWKAATTNPVIGNGTLEGGYRRIGSQIDFWIRLIAGSTTTYGTGLYTLSIPVAAADSQWNARYNVAILDNGVAWYLNYMGSGQGNGSGSDFQIFRSDVGVYWQPTQPFTFGNADAVYIQGSYRVA